MRELMEKYLDRRHFSVYRPGPRRRFAIVPLSLPLGSKGGPQDAPSKSVQSIGVPASGGFGASGAAA